MCLDQNGTLLTNLVKNASSLRLILICPDLDEQLDWLVKGFRRYEVLDWKVGSRMRLIWRTGANLAGYRDTELLGGLRIYHRHCAGVGATNAGLAVKLTREFDCAFRELTVLVDLEPGPQSTCQHAGSPAENHHG